MHGIFILPRWLQLRPGTGTAIPPSPSGAFAPLFQMPGSRIVAVLKGASATCRSGWLTLHLIIKVVNILIMSIHWVFSLLLSQLLVTWPKVSQCRRGAGCAFAHSREVGDPQGCGRSWWGGVQGLRTWVSRKKGVL